MSNFGFLRVAAVSTEVVVGDVEKNTQIICDTIEELKKKGVQLAVFPELCITGYTCGDLFLQDNLVLAAEKSLKTILKSTKGICVFVGLPLRGANGSIYNVAALLSDNENIFIYPKRFLPNYGEFYEKRWFASYCGQSNLFNYPIGKNVKINTKNGFTGAVVGCEICEDGWVPVSPASEYVLNGANVIVNLSAGNEVIGKADYRRDLIKINSSKNICAYIYANAGKGESTQDLVFSGHSMIYEYGTLLSEIKPFSSENNYIISDIDIEKLNFNRARQDTFNSGKEAQQKDFAFDEVNVSELSLNTLYRKIDGHPFVPQNEAERVKRCEEITQMQSWGLVKRLKHIGCKNVVVGISGGLDSTLAFLVCCRAFDILGLDRTGIFGITMPGFGTTNRTYENARLLVKNCGATLQEISIKEAASLHLKNLNHKIDEYDITYENSQARERTQILFDYANMHNGIVIGTGDLSELALGWCTYNGDHMSNYGVNNSIPKTLVRYLVQYYADVVFSSNDVLVKTLRDIIDTPVSPELLPPDKDGNIVQKTEHTIGSYILHDFFIYNFIRNGFSPSKIFFLAKKAVEQKNLEEFSDKTIKDTLNLFYKRFFSQQFKRSCMSDGVKVGTVSFSPRGDWRMPSDAAVSLWLKEVESLKV